MSGWITINSISHLNDSNENDNKTNNDEILLFNMRNRYSQGLGYIYNSNAIGDTYWEKAKGEFEEVINMIKDSEHHNNNAYNNDNVNDNDNDSNYKERYHLFLLAMKNLARCYDKESKQKGISTDFSISLTRSTLSLSLDAATIMDKNCSNSNGDDDDDHEKLYNNDSALLLRIGKLSMVLGNTNDSSSSSSSSLSL